MYRGLQFIRKILFCSQVKILLLPLIGKLSHSSKVLPVFTLPLGSRLTLSGRPELRSYRGDNASLSLPFSSAARQGAGDGETQRMRRFLNLFFLVEAQKPAEGDSQDFPVAKNKSKNWYTIRPVGMKKWPVHG